MNKSIKTKNYIESNFLQLDSIALNLIESKNHSPLKISFLALSAAAALLLSACSLAPSFERPKVDLPNSFNEVASEAMKNAGLQEIEDGISRTWWKDFKDERLNLLVDEALRHNNDFAAAIERVNQARNAWFSARAGRFFSFDTSASSGRSGLGNFKNTGTDSFAINGILSYELDLWGKVRDADSAAFARLMASKANRDVVRLAIIGSVVETYFGLISLNNQVLLSERTLKTRAQNYEYRQKEFLLGKISEVDMRQAQSEMNSVNAQLQSLKMEQNAAQTALLILLGRDIGQILADEIKELGDIPEAPSVPINLPSRILAKRPDIYAAEEQLKAANFDIGVARGAFFPTISLTAALGAASSELENLMKDSNTTWSFSGNFMLNIMNFGKTMANVRIIESQYREMLINYGTAVKTAFGDVRNALFSYSATKDLIDSTKENVAALSRALELVELRYSEGYTNYLEVLSMQSALFNAELSYERAKAERIKAAIALYRAMGGGWSQEDIETSYIFEQSVDSPDSLADEIIKIEQRAKEEEAKNNSQNTQN